jgi:hypothetical protein
MPDDVECHTDKAEVRAKARWRQSDLKRAIAAAEKAGLQAYRVDVSPDGTISIIVGAPEETADPGPYDHLRGA